MKTLISFAVLSALVSCGPAPELKRRAFLTSSPEKLADGRLNLDNKTRDEVLVIKYENKVMLNCDLKFKNLTHNISINLAEIPDHTVKRYTYEYEGKTLELDIDSSLKIFQNYQYPFNNPRYEMKNSANAEVMLSWTVNSLDSESVSNTESVILPENVPPTHIMQLVRDSGAKQFSCSLKAKAVAAYSDQFKELPKDDKDADVIPEVESAPEAEVVPETGDAPAIEAGPTTEAAPETVVVPEAEVVPTPESPVTP